MGDSDTLSYMYWQMANGYGYNAPHITGTTPYMSGLSPSLGVLPGLTNPMSSDSLTYGVKASASGMDGVPEECLATYGVKMMNERINTVPTESLNTYSVKMVGGGVDTLSNALPVSYGVKDMTGGIDTLSSALSSSYGVKDMTGGMDTLSNALATSYGIKAMAGDIDSLSNASPTPYGVKVTAAGIDTLSNALPASYGVSGITGGMDTLSNTLPSTYGVSGMTGGMDTLSNALSTSYGVKTRCGNTALSNGYASLPAISSSSCLTNFTTPHASTISPLSYLSRTYSPKWNNLFGAWTSAQLHYMVLQKQPKLEKTNRTVRCETCGLTLNSEQQAKQHFTGKSHYKKMKSLGLPIPDEARQKLAKAAQATDDYSLTPSTQPPSIESQSTPLSIPSPSKLQAPPPTVSPSKLYVQPSTESPSKLYTASSSIQSIPPSTASPSKLYVPYSTASPSKLDVPPSTASPSKLYTTSLAKLHVSSFKGSPSKIYRTSPSKLYTASPSKLDVPPSKGSPSKLYVPPSTVTETQYPQYYTKAADASASTSENEAGSQYHYTPSAQWAYKLEGSEKTQQYATSSPGAGSQSSSDVGNGNQPAAAEPTPSGFHGGKQTSPGGTPMPAGAGTGNQNTTAESIDKMDPVSKAVYNNMMEKLPKKRKKVSTCDVCSTTFNSDLQAEAHFRGSRHNKKIKLMEAKGEIVQPQGGESAEKSPATAPTVYYCDLCNASLNSEMQYQQHMIGTKHKRAVGADKVQKMDAPGGLTVKQPTLDEIPGRVSGMFHCGVCNISVLTSSRLQQHVNCESHKEKQALKAARGEQAVPHGFQ